MKNRKSFLKGALCGALAMLLAAGLVSCGLKVKNSNSGEKDTTEAISSETDKKLEKLESLINQYYLKDVDQDELQQGIYEGYIAGLNDPYSVYYDEEATKSFQESTDGEYDGIGAVMSQNKETGIITISQVYEGSPAEHRDEPDDLYQEPGNQKPDPQGFCARGDVLEGLRRLYPDGNRGSGHHCVEG